MEAPPELLTAAEVARRFRVSAATVSRWVKQGDLEAIRLPRGTLRFRPSDVERLMEPTPDGSAA